MPPLLNRPASWYKTGNLRRLGCIWIGVCGIWGRVKTALPCAAR